MENQLEDATTASMVHKADKALDTKADTFMGETNDTSMKNELLQSQRSFESLESGEEIAVSTQARGWYKGLTAEERSGAIGFSDGAFLGAFLAFAAPWPSSATNGCGAGSTLRDVGKYSTEGYVACTSFTGSFPPGLNRTARFWSDDRRLIFCMR